MHKISLLAINQERVQANWCKHRLWQTHCKSGHFCLFLHVELNVVWQIVLAILFVYTKAVERTSLM